MVKSFCSAIKQTGIKCNSALSLNMFLFISPDHQITESAKICQIDANWILGAMLGKENQVKEEKKKILEERRKRARMQGDDKVYLLNSLDEQIKKKEELLNFTRWKECRSCGHALDCKCTICGNIFKDKWLLIATSFNNTFRYAFHLHVKCCYSVMNRCGLEYGKRSLETVLLQKTL